MQRRLVLFCNDTATSESYTLSLHDALPISVTPSGTARPSRACGRTVERSPLITSTSPARKALMSRSEEHTSELQSRQYLVCRLLLEKKKTHHRLSPLTADGRPTSAQPRGVQ